ncbi:MAG: hypothetical protein GY809_02620, partial [Planctomycetes bacterium]|nr:hypothetical protein [Planctomycetota bacterium]
MRSLAFLTALLAITMPCHADILTVNPDGSAQYSNLSAALQQAQSGDTVLCQPGLYRGFLNRNLTFYTGSITIESEHGPQTCIVDCESRGRFLDCSGNQDALITLKGLTLSNAASESSTIDVSGGGLVMDNCLVRDCTSFSVPHVGGVIYGGYGSHMTLSRSKFFNNTSKLTSDDLTACGSVLSAWNMQVNIDQCIFADNQAETFGGVAFIYLPDQADNTLNITNSIFHNNSSSSEIPGSAMVVYLNQGAHMSNCIVTNNTNTAIGIAETGENANMAVENCLFFNNSGGLYYDLNLNETVSTVAQLNSVAGSSGNLSGQPHFATQTDFHLLGNSAAIDNGLTSPGTT